MKNLTNVVVLSLILTSSHNLMGMGQKKIKPADLYMAQQEESKKITRPATPAWTRTSPPLTPQTDAKLEKIQEDKQAEAGSHTEEDSYETSQEESSDTADKLEAQEDQKDIIVESKKVRRVTKQRPPVKPVDRIKQEIKTQSKDNLPSYCEQQLLAAAHHANIDILKHMIKKQKNLLTPTMISNTIIMLCNQLTIERNIIDFIVKFIDWLEKKQKTGKKLEDVLAEFRAFIASTGISDCTNIEDLSLHGKESLEKYIATIEKKIGLLKAMLDYLASQAHLFFTLEKMAQEIASRKDVPETVDMIMYGLTFCGKNTELIYILKTYGAYVKPEMLKRAESCATLRIIQLQIKNSNAIINVAQAQRTLQLFRSNPASINTNTPDTTLSSSCVIL